MQKSLSFIDVPHYDEMVVMHYFYKFDEIIPISLHFSYGF